MKYLRMIWRVARRLVWETAMDNTTGLAAQMAYVLLFALAPGTLFLWHLLGLFGTDPTKLHRMYLLLRSFMPPDPKVQDILESAVDRPGVGRARACALPSYAGKLFDHSSGAARRNFLCSRLDHRDKTFPALRGTIRSL